MTMTPTQIAIKRQTKKFDPGDWVEVANPNPENEALKGRYFEVIKATATRLTVYQNPARYDWERIEDEPIRPIYNLALAEVTPHRLDQPPSPGFHYAYGEMVMDDLNTENTNLASLRRYGIFAGYRDFPNMGRDYPPQPWIKWEDGTEGFTSEATLSTSPRPVYLREAPAVAVASDNNAPAINETPPESLTPPALESFDPDAFGSVHSYLRAAELIEEAEEFICPDGNPIAYRGWQIVTDSEERGLISFSVQTPEGDWYSGLCFDDGPLSELDRDEAIAYAKATIDNAIALAEKLSGQMSLLEQPAIADCEGTPIRIGDRLLNAAGGVAGTVKGFTAEGRCECDRDGVTLYASPSLCVVDCTAIAAEIVATDPAARLTELEADIEQGLGLIDDGIKTIWAAATAIREESLWQLTGHASYVDYCKERWGWGKATAHEHAVAGSVLNTLLLSGVPDAEIPESTRALMELNKVAPEQRPTVLSEAAASNGGRATAKSVKALAEKAKNALDEACKLPCYTKDEYAELRSAGIPVYRPDTSDEAIPLRGGSANAEGLAAGYIVPTAEHRPIAPDSAHASVSPAEDDPTSAKVPAPVVEASGGGYEVGRKVRVADRPGLWVVAQHAPAGARVMVWSATGKYLAHPDELTPAGPPDAEALELIAQAWLYELASVLGAEQVRSLLGEVA